MVIVEGKSLTSIYIVATKTFQGYKHNDATLIQSDARLLAKH